MAVTQVTVEPIGGKVQQEIAIVSSLGEHLVGNYVLVRVHDDSGVSGVGEASVTSVWSGETQTGVIALVREFLAPLVVGADPAFLSSVYGAATVVGPWSGRLGNRGDLLRQLDDVGNLADEVD